jgi:hypothetical protein
MPSVSRLCRQCGFLDIWQSCRPPRAVTGTALLFLLCVMILYYLCSFVCCVLFERGVLFCVLCLIVVPLPPHKNQSQVQLKIRTKNLASLGNRTPTVQYVDSLYIDWAIPALRGNAVSSEWRKRGPLKWTSSKERLKGGKDKTRTEAIQRTEWEGKRRKKGRGVLGGPAVGGGKKAG